MRKIILIAVAIEFIVLAIVGGLLWMNSQENKQPAEGYDPGVDGEWVDVNEDGLFAVVREDAPPDVEFVKAVD